MTTDEIQMSKEIRNPKLKTKLHSSFDIRHYLLPRAGRERHAGVIILEDLRACLPFERLAPGAPLAQAHAVSVPAAADLEHFSLFGDRESRTVKSAPRK